MSYNGSGVFNINTAGQPVVTGTVISSTAFNALTADLGTGLSTAITKNGQTTVTANIPFNGFKLTGIGVATASGDALTYGQAATVTTLVASTSITDSGLTSGRVTYAGTAGLLQDSANLTFNGTTLTAAGFSGPISGVVTSTSITDSGLTSGRVTYASTGGLLADSAALTWDGTTLAATKFSGPLNGTVGATTPSTGAFTTLSADNNTVLASAGNTKTVQIGSLSAPANVGTLQQTFNGASVWGGQTTVGGETDFGWNFYYYGGFKSRLADVASRLSFNATSGRVSFWTAPSPGSADAALTFTEALRIDATTGVTALGAMAVGNGLAVTGTLSSTGETNLCTASGGIGITTIGSTTGSPPQVVLVQGNNGSGTRVDISNLATNGRRISVASNQDGNGNLNVYDWTLGGYLCSVGAGKTLSLEGATPQTGTGITFPATQSASANANTLDDYEEGTWTPNQGSGLTVVGAFSSSAVYTKIGNLVYVRGYVQGATSISIVAGGVLTSNLPFSNGSDACGGNCTNYNVNQTSGIYIQTGTSVNATSAITASQQVIFGFTYRV